MTSTEIRSPESPDGITPLRWVDNALEVLDQRVLPDTERWERVTDLAGGFRCIRDMLVRGAPAIGCTAAYTMVLAARKAVAQSGDDGAWLDVLQRAGDELNEARPTAVNLRWAVDRMLRTAALCRAADVGESLLREALAIHREDIAANLAMGEAGAALLSGRSGVLTHCNAGSLATGGYGTALGVIKAGWSAQRIRKVFADETRPWLQGARLTAWELVRGGIPVDLIGEGAAAALLRTGEVGTVITGADRVAANGDVANKIGTYSLAVLARHHGVRFMVVAPTSTIDAQAVDGAAIPIEQRAADEVLTVLGQPVAARGAGAWNPVFDVTPASLVDWLVTEKGVLERPDSQAISALLEA